MSAYIVFTRESTKNLVELNTYSQRVGGTLAGHPVTVLAAYGRQDVLEGPEVEGVVILEFPTLEEAKAWYDSPAYRKVREHRFRGAEYRAVIVEGSGGVLFRVQRHRFAVLRHGDVPTELAANLIGKREGGLLFAVSDEQLARRLLEMAEPLQ